MELSDADSLGIKSVKGYFMLMNGDDGTGVSSQTTLKLMFLEHIKLIRIHPQKTVAAPAVSSPSVSSDSLRKDSASSDGKPLRPLREMKPMKAEPLKTR